MAILDTDDHVGAEQDSKVQLRANAQQFTDANLPALASELLNWRRTGRLNGSRFNELAALCALYCGDRDDYQMAEYLVQLAALQLACSTHPENTPRNAAATCLGQAAQAIADGH